MCFHPISRDLFLRLLNWLLFLSIDLFNFTLLSFDYVFYLLTNPFRFCSSCREFYYIQMEKYARQSVTEGAKSVDELHVTADCEIYRVLNLHYNRNNHIEVSN